MNKKGVLKMDLVYVVVKDKRKGLEVLYKGKDLNVVFAIGMVDGDRLEKGETLRLAEWMEDRIVGEYKFNKFMQSWEVVELLNERNKISKMGE